MTRPAQWDLLDCQVYVDGVRVEDGSQGGTDADVTVLAGLTVQWGRTSTVDQPEPATCSFDLMDLDGRNGFLELVAVGRRIDVDATGVNATNGLQTVRVFSGRVTDAHAVWDAAMGGVKVSVIAVDTLGQLGSMLVATAVMPMQPLSTRIPAILKAAGYTAPAAFAGTGTAGNIVVAADDIDRQDALRALQDLTAGLDLVLWGSATLNGPRLLIEDPNERAPLLQLYRAPGGLVSITTAVLTGAITRLDACDVLLDPVEWVHAVSDVATRVTVAWDAGNGAAGKSTQSSSLDTNNSPTGIRSVTVNSPLTNQAEAEALAIKLIYRLGSYVGWRINGLTLDLRDVAELDTAAESGRALALLDANVRIGRAIQLTGLPEWSPMTGDQAVYLEGGRYSYDGQGWLLAMDVSNGTGLGDSVKYNQLDPTWSYNDMDPSITFNKLIGVGP